MYSGSSESVQADVRVNERLGVSRALSTRLLDHTQVLGPVRLTLGPLQGIAGAEELLKVGWRLEEIGSLQGLGSPFVGDPQQGAMPRCIPAHDFADPPRNGDTTYPLAYAVTSSKRWASRSSAVSRSY